MYFLLPYFSTTTNSPSFNSEFCYLTIVFNMYYLAKCYFFNFKITYLLILFDMVPFGLILIFLNFNFRYLQIRFDLQSWTMGWFLFSYESMEHVRDFFWRSI